MKKLISYLAALFAITTILFADTNTVSRPINSVELTLGGGGAEINGESSFGSDITLSTNPFKFAPSIWTGVAQSIYWEPSFAGSTDVYADWSQDVWNDTLYVNVGWSGGVVYGNGSEIWRTGPEFSVQFYTHDNAFIYAGVNYDVWASNGSNDIRYSFGLGILF
jgi:hypothetical protein